ncbi:hypothetical protein N9355_08150 [Crocinitomicaceae bacterium]|nr:hypothetical protein [Crocinitomicaceae bacterium]
MRNLLLFFPILVLIACNEIAEVPENINTEEKNEELDQEQTVDKEKLAVNYEINRTIQLLSGMDTLLNYPHLEWDIEKIKSFARMVNTKFEKMKSSRLDKISIWNTNNMDRAGISKNAFCFYPFSGGDFVHAKWLYPEADEYLLIARERVGTIPDLAKAPNTEVMKYLDNVDEVLRDIYRRSYFITKNMNSDINDSNRVDGMLPIILWAMGRSEHDIVSIQYFDIDEEGQTIRIDPNDVTSKSDAAEVVAIHRPSGKKKTVTYVSGDISNNGFNNYRGIKKYLEAKVPTSCNSFLKSASYLLHYSTFSEIKNLIQDQSALIVQDDTGIPFKYFDQKKWTIELFGKYDDPVADFSSRLYQKDLDSAYLNKHFYKGPLSFSLGYHWGDNKQNYMFIHKK